MAENANNKKKKAREQSAIELFQLVFLVLGLSTLACSELEHFVHAFHALVKTTISI